MLLMLIDSIIEQQKATGLISSSVDGHGLFSPQMLEDEEEFNPEDIYGDGEDDELDDDDEDDDFDDDEDFEGGDDFDDDEDDDEDFDDEDDFDDDDEEDEKLYATG